MTSLVLGIHTRIHKSKCECTFNMFQNDNKNICSIDQERVQIFQYSYQFMNIFKYIYY
jgi:hypothetical protein